MSAQTKAFTSTLKVSEQLKKIIKEYPDILNEPPRLESLLRDIYVGRSNPTSRREINVIITSLEARINDYLLATGQNVTSSTFSNIAINNMTNKLSDEYGIDTIVGEWAVRCWASCLGVISVDELRNFDLKETNKGADVVDKPNNYVDLSNRYNDPSLPNYDPSLPANKRKDGKEDVDTTTFDHVNNIYNDPTLPNYDPSFPANKRKDGQENPSKPVYKPDWHFLDAPTWHNKGWNLGNLGRHNEAIECYDKAVRIDPNYTDAWVNKGWNLERLGRLNEAIECYDKAIRIDHNYALPLKYKGTVLDNLGRQNEAIEWYDKAIRMDPNYTDAWNGKGWVLNKLGKYNEAIECYDRALRIDPNYELARNNKDSLLKKMESDSRTRGTYYENDPRTHGTMPAGWEPKKRRFQFLSRHKN